MTDRPEPKKTRRRLPRNQREAMIIAEAIRFFAEVGFEGQTRALAQRLGVTQPLLYRYFPDKDALIDRVYQEVFLKGWNTEWTTALSDRAIPLVDRLIEFYRVYTHANFSYERVRLFMFAGLKDESIANRYMAHVHHSLFIPLCREMRSEAGVERAADVSPLEIEMVAALHGAIGYIGLRRWVFQTEAGANLDDVVAQTVRAYLTGMIPAFRAIAAKP